MANFISFHFQGLLYYWTKYYKKSVSIVNNKNVEHWGKEPGTDNLRLLSVETDILEDHVCSNSERDRYSDRAKTPYWNYFHFTGRGKPWYKNLTDLEKNIRRKENQTTFHDYNNYEYWLWLLQDALQTTGLRDQISLDFITAEKKHPSLGRTPSFNQRAQYIRNKAKNGWRQYEYEGLVESQTPVKIKTHKSVVSANTSENNDTRKWAYAFLLGGARSPNEYTEYIAGLYSVVASAQQLRRLGSRADIVLMVQIAAKSPHETLSEYEEEILRKMNIKIVYIPKFASSKLECFYSRKHCVTEFAFKLLFSVLHCNFSYIRRLLRFFNSKHEHKMISFSDDGEIQNFELDGIFSCHVLGLRCHANLQFGLYV